MEQTSPIIQSQSSMRDTELLAVPLIDNPASDHENLHPIASANQDCISTGSIINDGEECDKKEHVGCSNSSELLEESETYKKIHFEDSERNSSKSSAGNCEDQKPLPSFDSATDDTGMIIDVVDEPHTSAVSTQESCKYEDQKPLSSFDSATDDTVMIIDLVDEPHPSAISTQESCMDFKTIPLQITGVWMEFEHATQNNFTKGCKWSPDGSCILSCNEDAKMRLFNLPVELYQTPINWAEVSEMFSVLKVSEAELIYDYCWYPLMSSMDPVSCCFVSSSRCNPVHMWDAFTGELRCTYRSYNHLDEIVAAHGLAFDSDGQKLYCGFKNMIRIFNVSIPGRNFKELPTCVKKYGQKGIISCFAFSAENRSVFAAGSYSKTVGIYSEIDGSLMHLLDQQKGGVTHMCFSPDGNVLYCGGRNDPEIQSWDMRNLKKPLFQLRRICNTNQRMYFDISRCGRYVVSGNNNGVVTVWDVKQPSKQVHLGESIILEPVQFYQAHNDCVNGISFHPSLPLLATSSGQRQFPELLDSEGEESDGEMFTDKHIVKDNSIRLWWTGSSQQH